MNEKYGHLKVKILENDFEYVLFNSCDQMNRALQVLNDQSSDYLMFSFKGETSLICLEKDRHFDCLRSQPGWSGFKIVGEMPFGSVQGLISTISSSLAKEGLGVCVVSTFLTDIFFIRNIHLSKVKMILRAEGWNLEEENGLSLI